MPKENEDKSATSGSVNGHRFSKPPVPGTLKAPGKEEPEWQGCSTFGELLLVLLRVGGEGIDLSTCDDLAVQVRRHKPYGKVSGKSLQNWTKGSGPGKQSREVVDQLRRALGVREDSDLGRTWNRLRDEAMRRAERKRPAPLDLEAPETDPSDDEEEDGAAALSLPIALIGEPEIPGRREATEGSPEQPDTPNLEQIRLQYRSLVLMPGTPNESAPADPQIHEPVVAAHLTEPLSGEVAPESPSPVGSSSPQSKNAPDQLKADAPYSPKSESPTKTQVPASNKMSASNAHELDGIVSHVVNGFVVCEIDCNDKFAFEIRDTFSYLEKPYKKYLKPSIIRSIYRAYKKIPVFYKDPDVIKIYPLIEICTELRHWNFQVFISKDGRTSLKIPVYSNRPFYIKKDMNDNGTDRDVEMHGAPGLKRFFR